MVNSIDGLLIKENGVLTAKEARLAGIDNKRLQNGVAQGKLERMSHGLYMSSTSFEDEYFLAQYRCGQGIFSHETALFLHGLSDRIPLRLTLTIPTGFNSRILKDKKRYQFFYSKPELHKLGIIVMPSPYNHEIRVYDKERTICDCLKKIDKLDKDVVLSGLKQYLGETGNDYAKLLRYAEVLKIKDVVKRYLEVLI
jgi:predicted transcriptional regulator of viral defense system